MDFAPCLQTSNEEIGIWRNALTEPLRKIYSVRDEPLPTEIGRLMDALARLETNRSTV
jgi:hypothetical protein